MMTAPRTLHSHLVRPNYSIWSIELLPRSCALAARDRVLRRWTTSLYVELSLPPRQSRGASLGGLVAEFRHARHGDLLGLHRRTEELRLKIVHGVLKAFRELDPRRPTEQLLGERDVRPPLTRVVGR